ncbi:MAG: 4'-phosphopantetheinyl transferase superfamily protein [Muribaculaceae bacterium]|nr:4'-phosphopantetheinyl transferase superfamily protein [Muribaculaceae bacterium]
MADYIPETPGERQERSRGAVMALLRYAFGPDIVLEHREDGAPFLPGYPDVYISISHSRHYAAVATAPYAVGVDIEEPREQLRRVAPRVLSDRELAMCTELPQLLRAWTIKEALYKLHPGREACDFRNNIRIAPPTVTGLRARIIHEGDLMAPEAHICVVGDLG